MAVKKFVADGSMIVWSTLRLVLGFVFLWSFFDKMFGFKVATCQGADIGCSQAWVNGGSPTKGFLGYAVTGPFAEFYHKLAGHAWVDWLFMISLAVIGVGLLLGTWIRFAAFVGIALLLLMWSALLWPVNTPGIDEHIVYALVLFGIALTAESQLWTLQPWWHKRQLAKALPFLR